MRRLLAVNIGNTRTTFALYSASVLETRCGLSSRSAQNAGEVRALLRSWLAELGVQLASVETVALASVLPAVAQVVVGACRQEIGVEAREITWRDITTIRVEYDPPSSAGADRLCGAVAAHAKFGAPVVVMDLGTATVLDVVDASSVFRGGMIAAGLETSAEALHNATALLPKIELQFPPRSIGRSTVQAIQSGVLHGGVAMLDGLLDGIRAELGCSFPVVATGGLAPLMVGRLRHEVIHEPDLVLEGIRIVSDDW